MKSRILWYILVVSFVIAVVAVNILPDQIPAHYNFEGEVDRMGSKYETFIYPVMLIGMTVFWEVFIRMFQRKLREATSEKEQAEARANIKVLIITGAAVSVMQIIFQIIGIVKAYQYDSGHQGTAAIDMLSVMCMITGLVYFVVGNVLPKVKRNSLLGVRTKWSLANDEVWLATNRMGGILFGVGGILIVVVSVFQKGMAAVWMLGGITAAIVIVACIYSYWVYMKIEKTRK